MDLARKGQLAALSERAEPSKFKLDIIQNIPEGEVITLYRNGDFTDLCAGPHVSHTGRIGAFKLTHVASAYYKGDERNPQLQRIYGTAFKNKTQLDEYFAGDRQEFDLPLAPAGTPFQRQVWEALASIPYGEVTSYAALADRLGRPGSARAVGAANGANPLAIVVPCHRVVGADGTLTGYAGGLDAKRTLLTLEASPPAA